MRYLNNRILTLGFLYVLFLINLPSAKAISLDVNQGLAMDTTEIDSLMFICEDTLFAFGESFTEEGLYEIFQEGSMGMDTLIILEVQFSNLGGFSVSPSDTTVCFGESIDCFIADAAGNPIDFASDVQWSQSAWFSCDTCIVTSFEGLDTMEYQVEFVDANGCQQNLSGTYISERDDECFLDRVAVPNAFRPGSQVSDDNQTFGPIYYKSAQKLDYMKIYNRWGELVYQTSFEEEERGAWDGMIQSSSGGETVAAPMDVYIYDLVVFCPSVNKFRAFKGEVTLIR